MIFDFDKGAGPTGRYDVCIAGGGVAGIVLARQLARLSRRVLLLEGGGLEYSEASQGVYRGTITGQPYFDLDTTRVRFLGGTSNHWSGLCRPFDAYDFEHRTYIKGSGWPISIADISGYLREASNILEIPVFPTEDALKDSNGLLKEVIFRKSPPVLFNDKYREELAASTSIDVLVNANLVDIRRNPDNDRIDTFLFQGYSDSASIQSANADIYVLALGGIENARALLNANTQQAQGLGNNSDLVGRHFMEHPHFSIGYYLLSSKTARYGKTRYFLAPTAKLMQKTGIANAGFRLNPVVEPEEKSVVRRAKVLVRDTVCTSDIVSDFIRTFRRLQCNFAADGGGVLSVASEQSPNPKSRVTLGNDKDRFGLHRPVLHWQLTEFDKKTIRTGALEIAKYFARRDIGRIKIFDWALDKEANFPGLKEGEEIGGFHHIGTTRMGASKRDGVVDRDCRVFGTNNLFIAGSSVFPNKRARQSNTVDRTVGPTTR